MRFHVLTLFPEMVARGMHTSIIGRALDSGLLELNTVNIRDFTREKHGKVDDYIYGGGAGMLMQAQPVYDAWRSVCGGEAAESVSSAAESAGRENCGGENAGERAYKRIRTIYVTPQGRPFSQQLARELAREEELIFLCGHYEGIDERVLEETVTDRVSIGDYVLTGGELPAMVMMDAIARFVPGVLHNDTSAQMESFHNDLLEYPQYSRPEVWHGRKVPQVLLSGDHSKVDQWRRERAKELTEEIRPDLYQKYEEKQAVIKSLCKDKRNHIHMIESLARGRGEILYRSGRQLLVCDREASVCMLSEQEETDLRKALQAAPRGTKWFVVNQERLAEEMMAGGAVLWGKCIQYLYPQREPLPVKHRDIRRLTQADLAYVSEHYRLEPDRDVEKYVEERIQAGLMYGAFIDGRPIGFVGTHPEGGMGMLYVEEKYRGLGAGEALLAYNINRSLERGWLPYSHVLEENQASVRLHERLGLYRADRPVWWLAGAVHDGSHDAVF